MASAPLGQRGVTRSRCACAAVTTRSFRACDPEPHCATSALVPTECHGKSLHHPHLHWICRQFPDRPAPEPRPVTCLRFRHSVGQSDDVVCPTNATVRWQHDRSPEGAIPRCRRPVDHRAADVVSRRAAQVRCRGIKANRLQWADAVEVDRAIRHADGMDGEVFLHRNCVPLEDVDLRTDEDKRQMTLAF